MSAIYNTEPQPTGSVIMHTNHGELSVELFTKQTPLTSRNFLQHCLDGYYDNTIFHRLVPGFILQGGDPTGTGNGGESIYDGGAFAGDLDPWPMDQRKGKNAGPMGINFKDEFHSRLKLNRRGLLAMANEGTPDSNGSQFFFTLAKADELNGKNAMFGRIAGDTIYNLAKMGEAELDESGERPKYTLKLHRVEILVNPFTDMKKRERVARRTESAPVATKKPKKRKGGKQLLSFGDDEGGGEELPLLKKPKFDARIVMDVDGEDSRPERKAPKPSRKAEPTPARKSSLAREAKTREESDNDETHDSRRRPAPPGLRQSQPAAERVQSITQRQKIESSPEPETAKKKTALEKANDEIAALKASMKRNMHLELVKEEKKSVLEQMIPETSTRGKKRRPGANMSTSEEQKTLDLLKAFQSKLKDVPAEQSPSKSPASHRAGQSGSGEGEGEAVGSNTKQQTLAPAPAADEGEVCDLHFIVNCQSCQAWDKAEEAKDESDDEGWMSHALSFAADRLGKDLSYRKKAEEELIVIDPREKARGLQEGKKRSSGREGGASGRAWDQARDQARNAQLARSSALAGRGAK